MGTLVKDSKIVTVTGWKTGAGSTNTVRTLTVDDKGEIITKYYQK